MNPTGREVGGRRILVIDDDRFLKSVLAKCLRGFEVLMEADGLSGLKRAQSWRPDAIVVDFMLPKLNGLRVCRLLRTDSRTKDIPLVLLSVVEESDYQLRAQECGADAVLLKAKMAVELRPTLERLMASGTVEAGPDSE